MSHNNLTVYIQSDTLQDTTSLSILDILLDETLLYGKIYVPKDCFETVSSINRRLPAKQPYELVLRLAEHFPVCISNTLPDSDLVNHATFEFYETELTKNAILTDCYILSRYKKLLLEQGLFDAATESILLAADMINAKEELLPILSEMLSEKGLYLYYFLGSAPFLIYTGDSVCYNILSVFANALGSALKQLGHLVEYFDLTVKSPSDSVTLAGRKFQAIIGMQSYMFSIRLENNIDFLHDRIIGPKYNFVFDHPVRFERHLQKTPKDLTILTPDRNYANFANEYYPISAQFLPPAGILKVSVPSHETDSQRNYNVTFIATFEEFTVERFEKIHALPREERFLINYTWTLIRKNPTLTLEDALKMGIADKKFSTTAFLPLFQRLQPHLYCICVYYRYQVLKTLLDAGIKVDVFGASWSYSSLRNHPCFIWHDYDLTTEECLDIWRHSKLTLNVMSWHKDAVTERILNSMLQKTVVITERNPYICEEFIENEDIVLYDLDKLYQLPDKLYQLLSDSKTCNTIAENGYQKAAQSHTWNSRAKQLIALIDKNSPIS